MSIKIKRSHMILRILPVLFFLLCSAHQEISAQASESMPSFPGGDAAMYKYVYTELKYPAEARKNEITGQVMIQFQVTESGTMDSIKLVRKLGYGCDEEALRIVEKMKENYLWTPGVHNGVAAVVTYTLPIRFKLQ